MIKYLIFVFFTIFLINNCSFSSDLERNFINIRNLNFLKIKKKVNVLNFDTVSEKIISELLDSKNIFIPNKTSFFINLLRNDSNIILDQKKLTDIIKKNILNNTNKIYFFDKNNIDKGEFEISDVTSSIDTSTAIMLSRKNNIKYYLNSCILGKNNPFSLKIEIILVKTGEILFSKIEKFYW